MGVLQFNGQNIPEGSVLNKYLQNRLMERNQNALIAVTGATGSGKSYACLRIAELWYEKRFNKPFPKENITFSIRQLMERLAYDGDDPTMKLRKGEIFICEES